MGCIGPEEHLCSLSIPPQLENNIRFVGVRDSETGRTANAAWAILTFTVS